MIISFGKYKGQDLEEVPSDYLRWIVEKITNDEDLVEASETELSFRDRWKTHFWSNSK